MSLSGKNKNIIRRNLSLFWFYKCTRKILEHEVKFSSVSPRCIMQKNLGNLFIFFLSLYALLIAPKNLCWMHSWDIESKQRRTLYEIMQWWAHHTERANFFGMNRFNKWFNICLLDNVTIFNLSPSTTKKFLMKWGSWADLNVVRLFTTLSQSTFDLLNCRTQTSQSLCLWWCDEEKLSLFLVFQVISRNFKQQRG